MTQRPGRRQRRTVLAVTLGVALSCVGCGTAVDDELVPRPTTTVTITTAPTSTPSAVPSEVPVGDARLAVDAPAWATDARLQVGRRTVDVSPRQVDAFVVARGGVYFLDRSELWFTDFRRVRATGLTAVMGLAIDASRRQVRVTVSGRDGPTTHVYDTRVGGLLDGVGTPLPVHQRLGRRVQVSVDAGRVDLAPTADADLVGASLGPGRYGLLGVERRSLRPFVVATGRVLPLREEISEFRLGGWTAGAKFFGVTYVSGSPDAVVACDLVRRRCTPLGVVPDGLPVIFDTGSLAIDSF